MHKMMALLQFDRQPFVLIILQLKEWKLGFEGALHAEYFHLIHRVKIYLKNFSFCTDIKLNAGGVLSSCQRSFFEIEQLIYLITSILFFHVSSVRTASLAICSWKLGLPLNVIAGYDHGLFLSSAGRCAMLLLSISNQYSSCCNCLIETIFHHSTG